MRAVVQRVLGCTVAVENAIVGSIERGLLVYLGVSKSDTDRDVTYIVNKIAGLRIFEDPDRSMNLSVEDAGADICVVSQFTLYGDVRKGRRPSFSGAAEPIKAESLYLATIKLFYEMKFRVATGSFGQHMNVTYTNDGPVTILIDSDKAF